MCFFERGFAKEPIWYSDPITASFSQLTRHFAKSNISTLSGSCATQNIAISTKFNKSNFFNKHPRTYHR